MGLGTSIFLIAVGAILDFAVTVNAPGFNVHTVGVILMVVGLIGAVASLFYWGSWGGFNRGRSTAVYRDSAVVQQPVYRETVAPVAPRQVVQQERVIREEL
ncbi:MAG: hypothetical protein NVSMB32_03010 [Actinomycetota bacterium]